MDHIIEEFPSADTLRTVPKIRVSSDNLLDRALTNIRDAVLKTALNGENKIKLTHESIFESDATVQFCIVHNLYNAVEGCLLRKGFSVRFGETQHPSTDIFEPTIIFDIRW